jgi:hypothetical protein
MFITIPSAPELTSCLYHLQYDTRRLVIVNVDVNIRCEAMVVALKQAWLQ